MRKKGTRITSLALCIVFMFGLVSCKTPYEPFDATGNIEYKDGQLIFRIENLNNYDFIPPSNCSSAGSLAAEANAGRSNVLFGSFNLKNNTKEDCIYELLLSGKESLSGYFEQLRIAVYVFEAKSAIFDKNLSEAFGTEQIIKANSDSQIKISMFVWLPLSSVGIASESFYFGIETKTRMKEADETLIDPLQQSTILYYDFDETDKTLIDKSAAKRITPKNVITNHDPNYRAAETPLFRTTESAVAGKALAFDGVFNSVEIPAHELTVGGQKLTVDVFAAPRYFLWSNTYNNIEDWHTQTIVGQSDGASGFRVGVTKYGHWTFQVFVEGKGWVRLFNDKSLSFSALDMYRWNHLTCTYDGVEGTVRMYKNSVLVAELTGYEYTGTIKPALQPLYIAKDNLRVDNGIALYDMSHFCGLLDELKIYIEAKTQAQITVHHNLYLTDGTINSGKFEDFSLQTLSNDYYRPSYHAVPPAHWMNEPHALFSYKGKWHMFYQYNPLGAYWQGGMVWGHWISEDLVSWRSVKEALIPMENSVAPDGIWSGGVAFDSDGNPVLVITAGNDRRRDIDGSDLWSNQNVALATAKDYNDPDLIEWELAESLSIRQKDIPQSNRGIANEFRDPQVFEEDGVYYMVVCGRTDDSKPAIHLFTTTNGRFFTEAQGRRNYDVWTYRGNIMPDSFYDNYLPQYGLSAELPSLSPVFSEDKTIKKYILSFAPAPNSSSINIGSHYFLGSLNKSTYKFVPDSQNVPELLDITYKAFSGGTIYFDKLTKRTLVASIIQDDRNGSEHKSSQWAHTSGMIRELFIQNDGKLGFKSAANYNLIKDEAKADIILTNASVTEVNTALNEVNADRVRIKFRIKNQGIEDFGFELKRESSIDKIVIKYSPANSRLGIIRSGYVPNVGVNANNTTDSFGSLPLINGCLEGEIYIDNALVEGFFNSRAMISAMVYNKNTIVTAFGSGIKLEYFELTFLQT